MLPLEYSLYTLTIPMASTPFILWLLTWHQAILWGFHCHGAPTSISGSSLSHYHNWIHKTQHHHVFVWLCICCILYCKCCMAECYPCYKLLIDQKKTQQHHVTFVRRCKSPWQKLSLLHNPWILNSSPERDQRVVVEEEAMECDYI